MALPSSGQITLAQIYTEIYGSHTNQQADLQSLAIAAGFSTSNLSTATFYNYSHAPTPVLQVSPTRVFLNAVGGAIGDNTVDITGTNGNSWVASHDSWIIASPNSGTGDSVITITGLRYTESVARVGGVTINSLGGSAIIRVSQEGSGIPI